MDMKNSLKYSTDEQEIVVASTNSMHVLRAGLKKAWNKNSF